MNEEEMDVLMRFGADSYDYRLLKARRVCGVAAGLDRNSRINGENLP